MTGNRLIAELLKCAIYPHSADDIYPSQICRLLKKAICIKCIFEIAAIGTDLPIAVIHQYSRVYCSYSPKAKVKYRALVQPSTSIIGILALVLAIYSISNILSAMSFNR